MGLRFAFLEKLRRIRIPWWRVFALGVLLGAALLNQWFVLDNPELERQLIGCWAIAGGSKGFSGAAVLHVLADGTFTETSVNKLGDSYGFGNASGSWEVQRDEWTLNYKRASGDFLAARRGRFVITVVEANE